MSVLSLYRIRGGHRGPPLTEEEEVNFIVTESISGRLGERHRQFVRKNQDVHSEKVQALEK